MKYLVESFGEDGELMAREQFDDSLKAFEYAQIENALAHITRVRVYRLFMVASGMWKAE